MEDEKTLDRSVNFNKATAITEADYLQQKLTEAEARLEKAHIALLDARADLAYVHHRAQEDIAHAHKYAIEGFARSLLSVKDNLETALRIKTDDQAAFKEGIELVLKQLVAAFEAFALHEISPEIGEPFDPAKHRLVERVSNIQVHNKIAEVSKKGYQIGDRMLRPALVSIALPDEKDEK